jgi:hypothetical protein
MVASSNLHLTICSIASNNSQLVISAGLLQIIASTMIGKGSLMA